MKTGLMTALLSIAALLFAGLLILLGAAPPALFCAGARGLRRQEAWKRRRTDLWELFPLKQLCALASGLVYVDRDTEERLTGEFQRAQLPLTPRTFLARRWVILLAGSVLSALCAVLRFRLGLLLSVLLSVFALVRERDNVQHRIKQRGQAIAREMPRFVQTVSRALRGSRDLESAFVLYRRVAGPEMAQELDILLAEMRTGNVQTALLHFGNRLGTNDAMRLSAILQDLSTGVDQFTALQYLASDLARGVRETVRKELMLRPAKMRRTYYPAVLICVLMILYVLVSYVAQSLNSIW